MSATTSSRARNDARRSSSEMPAATLSTIPAARRRRSSAPAAPTRSRRSAVSASARHRTRRSPRRSASSTAAARSASACSSVPLEIRALARASSASATRIRRHRGADPPRGRSRSSRPERVVGVERQGRCRQPLSGHREGRSGSGYPRTSMSRSASFASACLPMARRTSALGMLASAVKTGEFCRARSTARSAS